jgi:molybdenum cofactor biosynthesis enzyme MoaA
MMDELKSLALFVGTGQCNARCGHCAGVPLRKYAPQVDGEIDSASIYSTIKKCYAQGARRLSISSSGEPTLSPLAVTKTLELVHDCGDEGMTFSQIHLYSNGIRIGEDAEFCGTYLPRWRDLGLTTLYVTVHDADEKKNARIYGVNNYPPLDVVVSRIHEADLSLRANIVLSQKTIATFDDFASLVGKLKRLGFDSVSAWPIRNDEDKVDSKLVPLEAELDKMERWVEERQEAGSRIRLLREKSRAAYETGQKLTLFPDGTLSNSWCNN